MARCRKHTFGRPIVAVASFDQMGRGESNNKADAILHGEGVSIRRPDPEEPPTPDTDKAGRSGPGRKLYKTMITIWSEFDGASVELSDLSREAESGVAFCSRQVSILIEDPGADPDWEETDFFDDFDEYV